MQLTEATMMQSRRSNSDRVAASRSLSSSSLIVGFLLDVNVAGGNVGFGLVVVVIGDEVLDRVVREERLELVIELRRQRLVVRQDQRRAVHLLDDLGHRVGLARAGDAEQHLVLLAVVEPAGERLDGAALVSGRLIGTG